MSYNRKFIVLPLGNTVTIAPGQKILKAEELQQLFSLEEMIQKSQEELQLLKDEASKQVKKKEKQAQENGFRTGLEKLAQIIADLEASSKKIQSDLEPLIIKIAVKAAQSVIERELIIDPTAISDIIKKTLRSVSQHKSITIFCHEDDLNQLIEKKPDLQAVLSQSSQIHLAAKQDLPKHGYIIQTERGIINRSNIEEVWEKLEAFLLKQAKGDVTPKSADSESSA